MWNHEKFRFAEGTFTVEAALAVPLCFLTLMSFAVLFQTLERQNDIQAGLLQAAETYGRTGTKLTSLELLSDYRVLPRWRGEGQNQLCFAEDRTEIPFLGSRLFYIRRYQQMIVSDYKGISMIPKEGGNEFVFVTANGKVYHRDRECTYLRTKKKAVTVEEATGLRNQSGGIYYPCESCCGSAEPPISSVVYLTSYGDRYHLHGQCPRIKRTVRRVRRSEVGSLPPCSKCGDS